MSSSSPRPTYAPRPGPMSSCAAVTWSWPTRNSWTTIAYGSKSNLTSGMPNSTGGWKTFMNVTPTGGTNAANLALFMVNVASQLQAAGRQHDPAYRVLDLKADCRGYKYVEETIKMLPEKPEPVLLAKIRTQVAC